MKSATQLGAWAPWHWPRLALLGLVHGYRFALKPWLGASCRFEPTCSAYALEALRRHGALAGGALTGWRLMRCHPWCSGGHDPVPEALRHPLMELLGQGPPLRLVQVVDQGDDQGNRPRSDPRSGQPGVQGRSRAILPAPSPDLSSRDLP